MRIFGHRVVVLLGMMWLLAGCEKLTSPQSSLQGEGAACWALVGIDSLMWQQPDSALTVMLEFAGSEEVDSLNEFEGHYCQVLVAELLFKNYYKQINRTEVLQAVGYCVAFGGGDVGCGGHSDAAQTQETSGNAGSRGATTFERGFATFE